MSWLLLKQICIK